MVRGRPGGVRPGATSPPVQLAPVKPLIVLPTYNEAENIVEVLDRVREAVPEADVLVVDDGSPDGTADLAERWGTSTAAVVRAAPQPRSPGLGSAYRAGFAQGLAQGYDVLIEMDSDLQHDPAALPALISAVDRRRRPGHRLALRARRRHPGLAEAPRVPLAGRQPLRRARCSGLQVRDATAGFRCYAAPMLCRIDLDAIAADGYGFQIEMAYAVARHGGRIVEVPITLHRPGPGHLEDVQQDRVRGARPRHLVGHPRPHPAPQPPGRVAPGPVVAAGSKVPNPIASAKNASFPVRSGRYWRS